MAAELTAQSTAGEAAVDFDQWMLAEQRRIFLLCWRMLGDTDEADTATQDVFLKAFRALDRQPEVEEERARWLTRVAVNTCLDRLRSQRWRFWRRRAETSIEDQVLRESAAHAPDAEARVFAEQVSRRLDCALERLSPRQRAVFLLRHYEDRAIDEIAAILGLDSGSVKSHLSRAVAKLRIELQDLYGLGKRT